MQPLSTRVLQASLCGLALSCSSHPPHRASSSKDAGADASGFVGVADNPVSIIAPDAGAIVDAAVADAFFINDPAPPVCGPNGEELDAGTIDASTDCPSDKHREGCPCDVPGQTEPCWPGKRINRDHGVCQDGTSECMPMPEFGAHWGPCQGYVLPTDGAVSGPEACGCFSKGEWAISNLVPCIYRQDGQVYLYSSTPKDGGYECTPVSMTPPPTPTIDWNTSTLNVDCAGQFELCYTMKAGSIATPHANDCALMKQCIDIWYGEAGKPLTLPNLHGWSATDSACAKRFVDSGGYGEMSVFGTSAECDAVDDGHGQPYVFRRTSYCPSSCNESPDRPECTGCATGGSGQF